MRSLIVALLVLTSSLAVAGEVYKWIDTDGKVHYGDKPKVLPAQQVGSKPGQRPGAPLDPEAEKAAASRKAACDGKRKQLESYKKATVINETDSLGNTREFSAAEKAKLLALTEQQVSEACAAPVPAAVEK